MPANSSPVGTSEAVATCDVFVLGGGPGGSTIAALLAERGWNVVIAEKDRHPRFHIGESLLPLNMPLFEHLGIRDEVERIGMPKFGAEFNSPKHPDPVTFDFSEALDATYPSSFEVRRSQFDEILFRTAVRKGAHAFEACKVTNVQFLPKEDIHIEASTSDILEVTLIPI